MGILTAYSTDAWTLYLNRIETEDETLLVPDDFTVNIAQNLIQTISGDGIARQVTFQNAVGSFALSALVINRHPGMEVVGAIPTASVSYLDQIRNILRLGLTDDDLSEFQIQQDAFLGQGELEVYSSLNVTPVQYDSKAESDPLYQQRVRTAAMYRTAALLVPALPEIIGNTLRGENIRYAEYDWQERINFYLRVAADAIEEDATTDVAGGVAIARLARRTTYF